MPLDSTNGKAHDALSKEGSSSARPKLLLVEDDADTQMMMRIILERDFDLEIAADGIALREILRKRPPLHAILMDISLHGEEDGLQLTKLIKASRDFCDMPVIALTAHASMEHQRQALDAGCDAVLTKPAKRAKILAVLSELRPRTSASG
jgi:two-component system, cell cycle response regulator DivK